jgi:hypothetical protein
MGRRMERRMEEDREEQGRIEDYRGGQGRMGRRMEGDGEEAGGGWEGDWRRMEEDRGG